MQQRLRTVLPILLAAAIGLGISLTIERVHHQLASDASYVSFCTVNSRVNCDVVLSSQYAEAFGVSISIWASLFYTGIFVIGVAIAYARRASTRRTLSSLVFAGSILGLLFSVYMAYVAFAVLNAICLLCSGLYLVSIALFALAWRLRGKLEPQVGRRDAKANSSDRSVAIAATLAGAALVVAAVWGSISPTSELSAEEIRSERPDFYKWFTERPVADVSPQGGNSFGPGDAPVTIVEFSDFGCGHCAAFDRTLSQVLRRGQNVRVVYRHFPLDAECNPAIQQTIHPHACLAAAAAECAADQGEFWRYHQLLFENQERFKRSELIEYARQVGLDLEKFEACLQSDDARKRVARDAQDGITLKIQSTPTLFINGRRLEGALDAQRLTDALTLAAAQ